MISSDDKILVLIVGLHRTYNYFNSKLITCGTCVCKNNYKRKKMKHIVYTCSYAPISWNGNGNLQDTKQEREGREFQKNLRQQRQINELKIIYSVWQYGVKVALNIAYYARMLCLGS